MSASRLHADLKSLSVRPRKEDLEHLIRYTPTGCALSAIVAAIVLIAIWPVAGGPVLGVWAAYTLGLNIWVFARSVRGSRRVYRVTARSLMKLRIFAILLALPWAALTLLAFGLWDNHQLARVVSSFSAVGMAAGGAFMLYRVLWSALLFLVTILGAVVVAVLISDVQGGWSIAAFSVVYCVFLSDFAINFARLDWSRNDALDALTSTVGKLEKANTRISELAYADSVTGLSNRTSFQFALQEMLDTVAPIDADGPVKSGVEGGFALLLMDLDRFKNVNDTLGHITGDDLLAAVGQRLVEICPAPDIVARLSGDEFAVLCHTPKCDLPVLMQRIVVAMAQPFRVNDISIHTAISVGAALCPDDARDPERLMGMADLALRDAKNEGHAQYCIYSPALGQSFEEANHLADEVRIALRNGDLSMRYQPKFRLTDGKMSGAEALIRWYHADMGFVSPDRFLPIAAERGLMLDVTTAVFDMVLNDMMAWRAAGISFGPVAINLHANDLKSPDVLLSHLERALGLGFGPEHLILEITEGCFSERNPEAAIALLQQISDMGFELSLDDFGTGYAALSHLRTLPVSEIKIDRSFVAEINQSERDHTIVAATLSIARSANLRTVVEGVETLDQVRTLQALGADYGQGYYWTPALSAPDLQRMALKGPRPDEPRH
ncbi:EAL domain-containing protein [Pseudooceanicola sediminis]|uniref:EAL domain-containing protein n=1 Tax=Pseudooceanicola sediminis TaxID=2211117 RepID=A0A399J4K2_9RHOB|nr:EAL domain-containing protein [Pseudooceanicola sediminis]KAA2315489.1 EAL domain-containing protein [Puniceibacterium sp. HSS470]RII40305.1 EAL domain-containing protein [Pseudooceanicola sediminis]|tara:strand:+ start:117981 stop:119975 length:1995 start_codon:yes stop_codon:yes gene_type:complete